MQGGGSLGSYECGVYKALVRHGVKFDIVAGASIGAINAGMVVGSKNNDPIRDLEDFWLNVAETLTPSYLPDNLMCMVSSAYAAMYGNPRAFLPVWFLMPKQRKNNYNFFSYKWPYLYDTALLKNTLHKYGPATSIRYKCQYLSLK
jgi:NTE family protein